MIFVDISLCMLATTPFPCIHYILLIIIVRLTSLLCYMCASVIIISLSIKFAKLHGRFVLFFFCIIITNHSTCIIISDNMS